MPGICSKAARKPPTPENRSRYFKLWFTFLLQRKEEVEHILRNIVGILTFLRIELRLVIPERTERFAVDEAAVKRVSPEEQGQDIGMPLFGRSCFYRSPRMYPLGMPLARAVMDRIKKSAAQSSVMRFIMFSYPPCSCVFCGDSRIPKSC